MGVRGPLKLPAHLRAVKTDTAGTVAEDVQPDAPAKPEHLVGELSTLWDDLVPRLDAAGLLASVDGMTVELALRHYLAARTASEELAESGEGVVVWDEKNERSQKHPADAVFRLQSAMYLQYAGALGLSFVSRARTPAAKGGDRGGDSNPYAATPSSVG